MDRGAPGPIRAGSEGESTTNANILAKLKTQRGHQGQRVRPHPHNPALWLAETYVPLMKGNPKGWRALGDDRGNIRTFHTSEQASDALLTLQKELDDLENRFEP